MFYVVMSLIVDAADLKLFVVLAVSIGFILNFDFSKRTGYLLSFMFHGLNSQIFHIGMFPYVCLASLILFCKPNEFPCSIFQKFKYTSYSKKEKASRRKKPPPYKAHKNVSSTKAQNVTTALLLTYIGVQLVLPYSHFITRGYNTWTDGLYGYSWDMMINSWETLHQKVTVRNYLTGEERYLDPDVWVTNDRWSSHSDMAIQYARCISRNLARFNITDIEIYMDVWKSLNGRFQQRMFDPRVNILNAPWSPFEEVTWVLPLLREFSFYRQEHFQSIVNDVSNWTDSSDVIFVADFPGLYLENYLPKELGNISITVLSGEIVIEQSGDPNVTLTRMNPARSGSDSEDSNKAKVTSCTKHGIKSGEFHKVHVASFPNPSCYFYSYTNETFDRLKQANDGVQDEKTWMATLSYENISRNFIAFVQEKYKEFSISIYLIVNAHLNLFFDVPMVIRKSINSHE